MYNNTVKNKLLVFFTLVILCPTVIVSKYSREGNIRKIKGKKKMIASRKYAKVEYKFYEGNESAAGIKRSVNCSSNGTDTKRRFFS